MPMAIPMVIGSILSTGMGIYSSIKQSHAQEAALKQQELAAKQAQISNRNALVLAKKQSFMGAAPDAQSAVGDSLTPESFSSMVASLTGSPGDIGLAQQTLYPGMGGGNAGQSNLGLSGAMSTLFDQNDQHQVDPMSLTQPY